MFHAKSPAALNKGYRGRLAPTPTGLLHLGHVATFFAAWRRSQDSNGELLLRIEDLDPARCKSEFSAAAIEDLAWLGLSWHGEPSFQSTRRNLYRDAWRCLYDNKLIYPSHHSRRDLGTLALAPHEEEALFPKAWRNPPEAGLQRTDPAGVNWRFLVPEDEILSFTDQFLGPVQKTSLKDFGDFLVWNRDDIPAYELAVVVDDIAMGITEVVRGMDLLVSTARQLLIYRALGATPPSFYHCPLLVDENGRRLAKRQASLSIRALRARGWTPAQVLAEADRHARAPLNLPA
ncbi:tRNA glutamyl-Q(34) synthetase GluQRS [soil metagenome]